MHLPTPRNQVESNEMSSKITDVKSIQEAREKHEKNKEQFHDQLHKLIPGELRCFICGYPLKKVRMTYETTMTIKIRSRMTMPIVVDTAKGTKGYTKEFQKQLHEGIVSAIVAAVEHARDDTDNFDEVALHDLNVDPHDFYIKGDAEISDFADIRLTYQFGKKKIDGEVLMTKAERVEIQ